MTLGKTKIPYLTRLWHPTTGCAQGCDYCWARTLVRNRLAGTMRGLPDPPHCGIPGLGAFAPTFHPDRLADPLHARKPQVIGVSFLGDLFDPAISDEEIAAVYGVMAACPQHRFIVLTKQAARMEAWFRWLDGLASRQDSVMMLPRDGRGQTFAVRSMARAHDCEIGSGITYWPLPNVWIGVSVSDQATADERIPHLLRTPAAHRWVSAEPMLGAIDLIGWMPFDGSAWPKLNLVMVGGESGPRARPMHPDWPRSLRNQCAAAGVRFCLKQWGEWGNYDTHEGILPDRCDVDHGVTLWGTGRIHYGMNRETALDDGVTCVRIGTKATGRLLDGVEHWRVPWMEGHHV